MANARRELILKAAVHLFNENGYHATSMHDVAEAASIKKPSVYHHFSSKEAILVAILEGSMDRLILKLKVIAESDSEPLTKLRDAIQAHALAIAENPESAAVFLREDRGLGDQYLTQYITKRDQFEEFFRQIVREGISAGMFRDLDVVITVKAILGMTNWLTRWYRQDGRLNAAEIANLFSNLLIVGLQRP